MANDVIQGDSFGTDLPVTQVDEQALNEEKKLAKYSQTKEFQRLRKFLEDRVSFYQNYLPNGEKVEGDPRDTSNPLSVPGGGADDIVQWKVACIVIREFGNILNEYDQAREAVDDATREPA